MDEIKINSEMQDYGSCPRSEKPMTCKYCGCKYDELNIYSAEKCCSFTCRTRQRRINTLKKDIKIKDFDLQSLNKQLIKLENEKRLIREKVKNEQQ